MITRMARDDRARMPALDATVFRYMLLPYMPTIADFHYFIADAANIISHADAIIFRFFIYMP